MPLSGGVREYKLPFSPKASLTEPFVGYVAKLLRQCMDDATEKWCGLRETLPSVEVQINS